jgi:Creatinine amidohydrolase
VNDRIVLPLGSTEQHAYLSLATDSILAERVAVEAAEPTGVPVPPVLAYSLTPLKDGKSQSGSQSRGWPEAQTPGWPGRRRVPRISLRCTDFPPVPAARQLWEVLVQTPHRRRN